MPRGDFRLLVLFSLFALLVSNTAGGLASRLARGLALAATAVLNAFSEITCFNGLNSLHILYLLLRINCLLYKLYHSTFRLSRVFVANVGDGFNFFIR